MSRARHAVSLLVFAMSWSVAARGQPVEPSTTATIAAPSGPEHWTEEQRRQAAEYDRIERGATAPAARDGYGTSLVGDFLKMVVVLAAVCLLAYLLLGKFLPRVLALNPAMRRSMGASPGHGIIKVVDRLPLDTRRTVFLLEVQGAFYLVGTTEHSMNLISEVDPESLAEPLAESDAGPILDRFSSLLKKKNDKET